MRLTYLWVMRFSPASHELAVGGEEGWITHSHSPTQIPAFHFNLQLGDTNSLICGWNGENICQQQCTHLHTYTYNCTHSFTILAYRMSHMGNMNI